MLATRFKTPFDHQPDRTRVKRQIAHRRIEEISLLAGERIENVFDRNVILIATARFVERVLKNPLTALREFIFICPKIYHAFQPATVKGKTILAESNVRDVPNV